MKKSHTLQAFRTITLTAGDTRASLHTSDYNTGCVLISSAQTFGPFDHATQWVQDGGEVTTADAPTGGTFITTVSAAAYNVSSGHAGTYIRMTATGAKTCTVRPAATHAVDVGSEWDLRNAGASGNVTIVEGSGVTVNPPAGGTLVLEPQMSVKLKCVATNVFDLAGATVAAV